MKTNRAYEEVIELIAAGSPSQVIAFRPSAAVKERVGDLVRREKMDGLSADEASELDYYLQIEHILRLAKARAKKYVSQ
jgi:hypothetical protein